MPQPSRVRYTWQDHQSIPESHNRHEIIDGELFVTPTPRVNHQIVAANLLILLSAGVERDQLGLVIGPITVHLQDDLVLEPDVVFMGRDHSSIIDPEGAVHGPPDLVVEILSLSTRSYDRSLKRKRYLESGVDELWIDVAARSVEVWTGSIEEPDVARDVLVWNVSGHTFEIAVADVFKGVMPPRS